MTSSIGCSVLDVAISDALCPTLHIRTAGGEVDSAKPARLLRHDAAPLRSQVRPRAARRVSLQTGEAISNDSGVADDAWRTTQGERNESSGLSDAPPDIGAVCRLSLRDTCSLAGFSAAVMVCKRHIGVDSVTGQVTLT